MTRASTTGVWAGEDPREAASRGATLAADEQGLLPFPLMSGPAAGGTRWACDSLGLATQLLPGLPADIGPAGWRLLGSRAATAARTLDARREQSRLGRALDALGEYAESSDLPVLLSVPGPWTLVRRLGLPDGSPVLRDSGARRDVIQSYTHGLLELREKIAKTVAEAPFSAGAPSLSEALAGREASTGNGAATGGVVPAWSEDPLEKARIRLVEDDLDQILTGTVPTVSGFRALPAIPDTHVVAALRSVAQRTGPHTILSLPTVGTVRISGKDVAHTDLAADADLTQLAVPVSSSSEVTAARIRQWERIAAWTEERRGLWLRVPATAASAPESVASWVEAVAQPWTGVGMARSGLAGFGILTGEELPTGSDPLLPETASGASSRAHVRMAGALARAFADQAG
ncbi:uroporphyrinogen decarboxylase/cobalamine-independent methonine synthase family protein [Brevibacterium yomogidense]|uniref:hypothetical protein n=1 Tax=Brevibacterium yomogidense TaxID=946573 RepID=UPI0018DF2AF6|nr:hypothetical protein [Brevibacterium yomogidense]